MRCALVLWLAIVLAGGTARADEIGIVVTGDPAMHDHAAKFVKGWLRKRGHDIETEPMQEDAIQTLSGCLAIDDQACARTQIEKHTKTDGLVYAFLEQNKKTLRITMYWFVRGHDAAAERRNCEKCSDDAFDGVADEMLVALARSAEQTGRVVIRSKPEDLLVLVDGQAIGQSPIERDLAPGKHRIVISQDGANVGEKTVSVEAGETTKVTLTAHRSDSVGQKAGSIAMITAGFGLLVTAGVMISYGTKDGPNEMYVYDNATGIGLVCGGVGVLGIVGGALLWPRSAQRTVPVATLNRDGAMVGLAGRF
jgi:hypothetical protein